MKNGLDEEGYIDSGVAYEKILPEHRAILDEIADELMQSFGERIHGIYVYGSVARGQARYGESDLDLLVVTTRTFTDEENVLWKSLESDLSRKYAERFREIGLESIDLAHMLNPDNLYGYPCFLKHLSVYYGGENLLRRYPKFRPDVAVARAFNGDSRKTLEKFRKKLQTTESYALSARSASKKILRTAFSLVMPRDNSWTTESSMMAEIFERYYPEKSREIRLALQWASMPPDEPTQIIELMDTFGVWLAEEFDRKIPPIQTPDYPDAYWMGHAEFMGLDFRVDPRALVPRLETEVLVKKAWELIQARSPALMVDTGTGSGIIPIALAKKYAYTNKIIATDIDSTTLSLARENADIHGMKIKFIMCDLLDADELMAAIGSSESVIFTANLPYVPTRDTGLVSTDTIFEPQHALYSGEDGFEHIARYLSQFAKIAEKYPTKPLALVMEMDPSHVARVMDALAPLGGNFESFADYAGDRRFISWTRLWTK